MLLEREDGSTIQPGEDIRPQGIDLPPLGKRQTPMMYWNALTMEQAFALAVVAKVSGITPDAVMRTKLAKRGLTVYPNGDAPQDGEAVREIPVGPPIGPEHPMGYTMAGPEPEDARLAMRAAHLQTVREAVLGEAPAR